MEAKFIVQKGFSRSAKIIILAQSIVIAYFSFWTYENYLNNIYFQQYVDSSIQANLSYLGLGLIGALVFPVLWAKFHSSRRKITGTTLPESVSIPVSPTLIMSQAAATNSTPVNKEPVSQAEATPKPSTDFHPVVASLRAELAAASMPFGTGPVQERVEARRDEPDTAAGGRAPASLHPMALLKVQPPGVPVPVGPMSSSKAEPTGSAVGQPAVVAGPTTVPGVTTVITGMGPVVKKKEPVEQTGEKPPSQ